MSMLKKIWLGLAALVCGGLVAGCLGANARIWTAILNEEIWG